MKNFLLALLTLALSLPLAAQEEINQRIDRSQDKMAKPGMQADIDQPKLDNSDFERMVNTRLMVDFRKTAIEAMELSEDEINEFDPIFDDYQRDKEAITARRRNLINQYREEMSEDDTPKDELGETGEFIEDYWELDIAEMELKKDYFDRLDDEIGAKKALKFFALDAAFKDRVDRMRLLRSIPTLVVLEPGYVSYQRELDDFNRWATMNIDGKVDLNHEFIGEGLNKLLNAVEAMKNAEAISIGNFTATKGLILEKAKAMQTDRHSDEHADYAADAFKHTASLLSEIATQDRFSTPQSQLDKLKQAAEAINPDQLLTDQKEHVYTFFDAAEKVLNDLVSQNKDAKSFGSTNR
ncbi:hypothetical protein GGR26_003379 [Lewinella marina]|uniref:DUF885 domain-containing protein n=1 Tax=Neolewinella marina TaxID=438751 RepID=A0A2G0CCM1_9BACT|nr:hypothetical protein [Neolewinella marina]NJB87595.1 hypothetical protein [Neolewinella marina]PHK97715.1 hypothetical protein CGL56_14920 [Neolewinella marina]